MKELERIKAVNRFLKLEISKEKELQDIVSLAASICGTETALITFIDEDTQYIKFKQNFAFDHTTREQAFCNHVIEKNEVMIVPDARKDPRFVKNPLVTHNPSIRFYAGAPLTTQDGHNLGSLCVIDQQPLELNELQKKMLIALSKQAIQLLEFDISLEILKDQYLKARRAESEMRAFFETSTDCHLLLGKNFEIIAFNRAWQEYVQSSYGLTLARGKSMREFIHPANIELFYEDYCTALNGKPILVQRKVPNGLQDYWRMIRYEPAYNNEGKIFGVSVNSTDITSKIEQEEVVSHQNESLKEIARIQSHELRRPVATILGLVELLRYDAHAQKIEEIQLLEKVTKELDEKIHSIIGYTNKQSD